MTTTEPAALLLRSLTYPLEEPHQLEHGYGRHPNARRSTAPAGSGSRAGGGTQHLSGPHSGPQRNNRPDGAFKQHRLTCTLFVGLPRFELGTFGPPDRCAQLIVSFGDQPSEVLVGILDEFEALDFGDPNSSP